MSTGDMGQAREKAGRGQPATLGGRGLRGLLVLAAVVAVAGHLGEGRRFAALVCRAQAAWLLVAAAL